jgi:hypothetical protein
VGLWKKGVKTQKLHPSKKFLSVGSTVHLIAWSRDFDQAVARAKIQQCVGDIF